jgi:hypothetical protein
MKFDLITNALNQLVFVAEDGGHTENARPARLFPLTDPEHWITIQDATGRELACVEDPSALSQTQRAALDLALSKRAFVPVVKSIDKIVRAADGYDWHVTTDRGQTVFHVETDESIQTLGGSKLVIIDDHNTRYLVPNVEELDRESRRRLERYY